MDSRTKAQVLRRLNNALGHLEGVMRMVEQDQYCVDIMKQSYAVRSAIDKVEALILDSHLRTCVVEGVTDGRGDEVIEELMDLYEQAKR